jgi:hypothetical protein
MLIKIYEVLIFKNRKLLNIILMVGSIIVFAFSMLFIGCVACVKLYVETISQ